MSCRLRIIQKKNEILLETFLRGEGEVIFISRSESIPDFVAIESKPSPSNGLIQELLYRWTEHSVDFFEKNVHWGREARPPNYSSN